MRRTKLYLHLLLALSMMLVGLSLLMSAARGQGVIVYTPSFYGGFHYEQTWPPPYYYYGGGYSYYDPTAYEIRRMRWAIEDAAFERSWRRPRY